MDKNQNAFRIIILLLIFICIVLVAKLKINQNTYLVEEIPTPLKIDMDMEVAKLVGNQPRKEGYFEKAEIFTEAIRKGDFVVSQKIVEDLLSQSKVQGWTFFLFAEFYKEIENFVDPALEQKLNEWVERDKRNPVVYLIRSQFLYKMGYRERGKGVIETVSDKHVKSFEDYIKKALHDIDEAIALNDKLPIAYLEKERITSSYYGDSPEMEAAFQQAIAKYPNYYRLYRSRLYSLSPKWGGSIEKMYAFADKYAGNVSPESPLKMIYINLFGNLLDAAAFDCNQKRLYPNEKKRCIDKEMNLIIKPQLAGWLHDAVNLYTKKDDYFYNKQLQEELELMIANIGGGEHFGLLLQLIADKLGSDTQVMQANVGNNNYVLDSIVGQLWVRDGNYESAEKKFKDALADIKNTSFPLDSQKEEARANVYYQMSSMYSKMSQHENAILYQRAAMELKGKKHVGSELICKTYFELKQYEPAIKECDKLIEESKNYHGFFYRAAAEKKLGNLEEAYTDFITVADSQHSYRKHAAVQAVVMLSERNDDKGALELFKKYTYLFDPKIHSDYELAVNYNNRCYTYLKLEKLKEALDDCNTSLKYGNIPDALHKRQEIIQLLKH